MFVIPGLSLINTVNIEHIFKAKQNRNLQSICSGRQWTDGKPPRVVKRCSKNRFAFEKRKCHVVPHSLGFEYSEIRAPGADTHCRWMIKVTKEVMECDCCWWVTVFKAGVQRVVFLASEATDQVDRCSAHTWSYSLFLNHTWTWKSAG